MLTAKGYSLPLAAVHSKNKSLTDKRVAQPVAELTQGGPFGESLALSVDEVGFTLHLFGLGRTVAHAVQDGLAFIGQADVFVACG